MPVPYSVDLYSAITEGFSERLYLLSQLSGVDSDDISTKYDVEACADGRNHTILMHGCSKKGAEVLDYLVSPAQECRLNMIHEEADYFLVWQDAMAMCRLIAAMEDKAASLGDNKNEGMQFNPYRGDDAFRKAIASSDEYLHYFNNAHGYVDLRQAYHEAQTEVKKFAGHHFTLTVDRLMSLARREEASWAKKPSSQLLC